MASLWPLWLLPLAGWGRVRHYGASVGPIWSYHGHTQLFLPADTPTMGHCTATDSYLTCRRLICQNTSESEESVFVFGVAQI